MICQSVQGSVCALVCLSVCVRAFSGRGPTHVYCKKRKKGRFKVETRINVSMLRPEVSTVHRLSVYGNRQYAVFFFFFFFPRLKHQASSLPFDVTLVHGPYRVPCIMRLTHRQAKPRLDKTRKPFVSKNITRQNMEKE